MKFIATISVLWLAVVQITLGQAQTTLNLKNLLKANQKRQSAVGLDRIRKLKAEFVTVAQLDGEALKLAPDSAEQEFSIFEKADKKAWQNARYLVVDLYHNNYYLHNLIINFYARGTNGTLVKRCYASIGIMPELRTKAVLPLSYLDLQQVYLPRFARQMKGRIFGNAIKQEEIADVRLALDPFDAKGFRTTTTIKSVSLQAELDNALPQLAQPYINTFGEVSHKAWPGKIQGEFELGFYLRKCDTLYKSATVIKNTGKFGGLKALKSAATGWFRTERIGNRWWLIDPDGYAFLSTGVNSIRTGDRATITGFEELYQSLPEHLDTLLYVKDRFGKKSLSFLEWNLSKVYGKKRWKQEWAISTKLMLNVWRFNTIGNWSDTSFIRLAKMPYVVPLKNFPTTRSSVFRDFPDVFDPTYQDSCTKFAQQLLPYKNDPYLIGYFLRNEPEWAFGDNNLALEVLKGATVGSYTRKELVNLLINQYRGNTTKFNADWGLKVKKIEELALKNIDNGYLPTDSAQRILKAFNLQMVDAYLKPVCNATKLVDPYHLNLGIRYAWISSDLCYHAGQYFDVFSVNGYNAPEPPPTAEITTRTGRPVLIGEFHFGALDQGLPANGIKGVMTQDQRGVAYQYYLEQGYARPEVIGIHYFAWNDQPVGGRFDGENYNIGLVNVGHLPYQDFAFYVGDANERAYDVARKLYPAATRKPKLVPAIY